MGVLLAVDPIPNAFRTVANVTGMLAVAVLADRRLGADERTNSDVRPGDRRRPAEEHSGVEVTR
jgi:Na+/H+-dicarboxylate symporter